MAKVQKKRIDELLVDVGLAESVKMAQSLVLAGQVLANDLPVAKAGDLVPVNAGLRLRDSVKRYVSRGGEKLAGAHRDFKFDIAGKIALDVGISTGGFTDYLLQYGAKRVFGLDVGYGQVAMKLQQNPAVVVLERVNARLITPQTLREQVKNARPNAVPDLAHIELVVMDLSFISAASVLPIIKKCVRPTAEFVVLIKPQFEAEKNEIEAGGFVSNPSTQRNILTRTAQRLSDAGFNILAQTHSPITGTKGNQEYFFYMNLAVN